MSKYISRLQKATIGGVLTLTLASGCSGLVERISGKKQASLPVNQAVAQYIENHQTGNRAPEKEGREEGNNNPKKVQRQYADPTKPVTEQRSFLDMCLDKCLDACANIHPRVAAEYDFNRRCAIPS